MARLRYTAITSLDGYVNDSDGGFAWAEPSDELHLVVNILEREVGTHLLGVRGSRVPGQGDALRPCGQGQFHW